MFFQLRHWDVKRFRLLELSAVAVLPRFWGKKSYYIFLQFFWQHCRFSSRPARRSKRRSATKQSASQIGFWVWFRWETRGDFARQRCSGFYHKACFSSLDSPDLPVFIHFGQPLMTRFSVGWLVRPCFFLANTHWLKGPGLQVKSRHFPSKRSLGFSQNYRPSRSISFFSRWDKSIAFGNIWFWDIRAFAYCRCV